MTDKGYIFDGHSDLLNEVLPMREQGELSTAKEFLKENGQASTEDLIRHIDYATDLVGIEHVALGLDVDYHENGRSTLSLDEVSSLEKGLFEAGYSKAEAEASCTATGKDCSRALYLSTFKSEQSRFQCQTFFAAVSFERAIGTDHAMTRHKERPPVAAQGASDASGRIGPADRCRDVAVG